MRALWAVSSEIHICTTLTLLLLLMLLLLSLLYESQCWHINQERFHIQKLWMKKLKKKEKKKLYVRWGVYNSLHWQISSSELSEKITQAMKKFSSANLTHTKQANTCQQTLTTVQQPFQKLRTQPWRKRKRWCHELNSY